MTKYQSINYDGKIPDLSEPFTIKSPPGTDVWEKPPSVHSFSAPIIYTTTNVSSFRSARVTFTAKWRQKYDQGGLALIVNSANGTRRWVKCGIEFLNDEAHFSVVATDRWSDWSLRPLLGSSPPRATVELERHDDGSLWVYLVGADGTKHPAREIAWWGDLDRSAECWVGIFVAKPSNDEDGLVVEFSDLSIVID